MCTSPAGRTSSNGDEALVNMQTGISTLVRDPGARVQGLIVPNDASTRTPAAETSAGRPRPSRPRRRNDQFMLQVQRAATRA